jgi:hypothetical protein
MRDRCDYRRNCRGTSREDRRLHTASNNSPRRNTMPLLIPILIGVPVVFGGGWVIYHFVH